MAVRIVVEKGPDQGKAMALDTRAEMRIGRGPGNHLMVQDPAWQGSLRVSFNQGVCKVTNQTPTTIYLGGKTFPPGEQRAWFHGESLQPTAQTLLMLYVEDAGKTATDSKAASKKRKTLQLAIILMCLPVAALAFFSPTPDGPQEPRTPEQMRQQFELLESQLQELQKSPDGGEAARRIMARLREARFEQLREHPARAFRMYHQVREEVDAELGPPAHRRKLPEEFAAPLRRVQDYVNQQLLLLEAESRKQS
jgi:hypothetical protein